MTKIERYGTPWSVGAHYPHIIFDVQNNPIINTSRSGLAYTEHEVDLARRIVACVNACMHIETIILELVGILKPVIANVPEAKFILHGATNEALYHALKILTFMARTSGGTAGPDKGLMEACENAEKVLQMVQNNTAPEQKEQRMAQLEKCLLQTVKSLKMASNLTDNEGSDYTEEFRECIQSAENLLGSNIL